MKNDPDASEEQKKELQEIIDNCDELLDKLDEVKEKIEEVKKPDGGSEPLDPGAVDKENKDDAQQVVDKIEDLLDEEDSHLAEEERKELEDLVDQLEDAIGEVEEVEQLEEDVRQLPEDLRDATSEEQKDILDRYSQLSEHQKEMMDPALRERIEALVVYTGAVSYTHLPRQQVGDLPVVALGGGGGGHRAGEPAAVISVSYTHLDVYKSQPLYKWGCCTRCSRKSCGRCACAARR